MVLWLLILVYFFRFDTQSMPLFAYVLDLESLVKIEIMFRYLFDQF